MMIAARFSNQRLLLLFPGIAFCFWVAAIYRSSSNLLGLLDGAGTPPSSSSRRSITELQCPHFPGDDRVQIIVKTGANEIYHKLPTQLLTSLRCYEKSQILIFSDLEQQLGHHVIHDALDNVTESVKESSHFDYYRSLKSLQKEGIDPSSVDVKDNAAWNLDKFKFLHVYEKTWMARPGMDWYVFIEADTYLVRTNLMLWLRRYSKKKILYLGSAASVNDENFAHGGSGVVLSGEALRKFVDGDQGVARRYDVKMQNELYGDMGLKRALEEKEIKLTGVWPVLQGETPATIPHGGGHWCLPVVTLHHMSPDEASVLWEFEQKRLYQKKPMLVHEFYRALSEPHIGPRRDDWDNHSDDLNFRGPGVEGDRQREPDTMTVSEKQAYLSFENCRQACIEEPKCYQFLYKSDEMVCSIGYPFRLGMKSKGEAGKASQSGWLVERIERFKRRNVCVLPKWN